MLPTDVPALVRSGRVDRRLFDVTALLEFGYDDARRADMPLIVQYAKTDRRAEARSAMSARGATVRFEVPAARGLAVRVDKQQAAGFRADMTGSFARTRSLAGGVDRVWLDGVRRIQLDQSVPQVGRAQSRPSGMACIGWRSMQVSFDDGATWQPATLTSSRDAWRASVTHPAGPGHVSLRAQATDGRGNTGHVTIIRAYHIG